MPAGPALNFDLGDEVAPAVRQIDARAVNRGVVEPRGDTLFSLIDGVVKYEWRSRDQQKVSVYPA